MAPFKKTYTLLHTPLIGKERAALKDNPKIFNAALRAPGDERKAKATVSDLVTFSGWFRSYVSSSDALGGSSDLLEGVEVPVEVPFDTLEAALEGLYQGSIEISTDNLEGLLQLADALLMDELREQCVSAALDSIPDASRAWASSMHSLGSALGVSKLTERAIGHMAYNSLDINSWLGIFADSLTSHSSSPSAQLAAIFNGLGTLGPVGAVSRWPTSIVIALLMRVDQLTDVGQPSSEERQQRKRPRPASPAPAAALDVAALLREVNFNHILPAEHWALSVMATNCSKETPALSLLMRRLLQRESGELPAHEAGESYQAGAPGTWVAGSLDLSAAHWANPGPNAISLPLSDITEGSNKLFGSDEGAGHAAKLAIIFSEEKKTYGAYIRTQRGKSLADASVRGYAFYCISTDVAAGIFMRHSWDHTEAQLSEAHGWGRTDTITNWKARIAEGTRKMVVGAVIASPKAEPPGGAEAAGPAAA